MSGDYTIPNGYTYDGLRLGPVMPVTTLERIRFQLEFDGSYVLSASHAKTGSTWVNEILFQLLHDCDPELTMGTENGEKFPFIEMEFEGYGSNIEKILSMEPPRLAKTHLPVRYFERNIKEGGPKFIVTVRNPKDTLVSLYHFYRMDKGLGNYTGTWDEFFQLHKSDKLLYEDFFKYYSGWMKFKNHPNVYFIKYEDLQNNVDGEIRRLAEFLGKTLTSEQLANVIRLSSFTHMSGDKYKRSKTGNLKEDISTFFRKGKVGDWKNYFSSEQSAYVDEQCKSLLSPLGFEFQFE